MTDRIARVISFVTHPLLVPLYVLALLMNLESLPAHLLPAGWKWTLAGVVTLTTVIFPLFIAWMLRKLGMVADYYMETREERVFPIMAVSLFYYLTYFLLKDIRFATIFSYYMLGSALLSVLALAVHFFRKISLHMIASGSVTGMILGLVLNFGLPLSGWLIAGILAGGVTGFARLRPGAHKPSEIYPAFLLGVAVMAGVMILL